ncbi:MAG: hypothetical protein OXI33_14040 [Chloroflexota bacterium]|nr:hypothetical protein [Chloroflexota bacterium]
MDGSFLVSDFFEDRILRYARDGTLSQMYGGVGEGPGEFLDLGPAFILNDTVVVGVDDQRRLLQMFRRADGSVLGSQPYRGRVGASGYSQVGQSVVFPSRELRGLTSVAIWSIPDQQIDYVVPLPDEYVRSAIRPDGFVGQFAAFQSLGNSVAWEDTILSGMSGLNSVFVSTWDGITFDTLRPPAVRRRGVPEDIQQRMDANDLPEGPFEISSGLLGLYRLSDGAIVLFHHDATLEGEQPHGTITADIYLSVIAPDLSSACVDGLVPHFKSMRAIHTVVRDTVFLLDRRVNEEEERLDSWIRMYRIDTSRCSWLQME